MPKVLHITAHMGGGIGNALSAMAIYSKTHASRYEHQIILLEKPEQMKYVDKCISNGVPVRFYDTREEIVQQIEEADIIQISWTHHPKMAEFLFDFPDVKMRCILWSHVSGCNYPQLPYDFLNRFQYCLFTSKYSYENPFWTMREKRRIIKHSEIIYGCGDLNELAQINPESHRGFNVGYIGTLSYSKLHPRFAEFCKNVTIPNVRFILVGDCPNQINIEEDIEKENINEKFEFTGYVSDVSKQFGRFDVFGYPLNPNHYGTTENVILEAMMARVPVVAMNQCTEKYIIQHMETGLLANDMKEYGEMIDYLYHRPKERKRLSDNARDYVIKEYSMAMNIDRMEKVYDKILQRTPESIEFKSFLGEEPYMWFLSCLGKGKKAFEDSAQCSRLRDEDEKNLKKIIACNPILREKTKSSIIHFSTYFPTDKKLKYWKEIID